MSQDESSYFTEEPDKEATHSDTIIEENEEPSPIACWTSADVLEFQELWSTMIGTTNEELKTLGITLLIWMFEHVKDMKLLFRDMSTDAKDALVSEEKFLRHAQRVVVYLNKLIRRLSDADKFNEELEILSRTHIEMKPPVVSKYFEDFRDNFHLLVMDMTGLNKKSRPAVLWYQFLDAILIQHKKTEGELNLDNPGKKKKQIKKSGCCSIS